MTLGEKLKKIRKMSHITQEELALKMGVNAKTIGFWETDKNIPSEKNLTLICEYFNLPNDFFKVKLTNDPIERALTRASYTPLEKSLFLPNHNRDIPEITSIPLAKEHDQSDTIINIDYYTDVFASCGKGTVVYSEEKEKIEISNKIISLYSPQKKYSCINASGNSMHPFIEDGDKLIVEHINDNQIYNNQIHVFLYEGELYIKRLEKNIDEISVISDNKDGNYRTRFIKKENMNNLIIIGRIVGLIRQI